MQTTSQIFKTLRDGGHRPISSRLKFSFAKEKDSDVDFFVLDTSQLDGTGLLAPSDNNIVQEWDKYEYLDYSNRVDSFEVTQQENIPNSVSLSMVDITLNNYDDYFTPGSDSSISTYILPSRPFRLFSGFGINQVPIFVGLTDGMPSIDANSKTVRFHGLDFLSYLLGKSVGSTVMLQNRRTDEILDYLFQQQGLTSDQYILDIGINTASFCYFEPTDNLGTIINNLMQAEIGKLYMNELGIIIFKNRYNYNTVPVARFDKTNTISAARNTESNMWNIVDITGSIRDVQDTQQVYSFIPNTSSPISVAGNGTSSEFFAFNDPIFSIETITDYTFNSAADGSGTDLTSSVTISNTDLFSKSVKVTFVNSGATLAYLISLKIDGDPAIVTRVIRQELRNNPSITKYEESKLEISNDFVQTDSAAQSIGGTILYYYSNYGSVLDLTVKGDPSLQIGDCVTIDIDYFKGNYIITKIINNYFKYGYTQRLLVRKDNLLSLLTLDESTLDGEDVLAP